MYHKVIVPLDGSRLSELALPHAEALARQFKSEILLIRVCQSVPVPFDLYALGPDVTDDYDQAVQAQAEKMVVWPLKSCRLPLVPSFW